MGTEDRGQRAEDRGRRTGGRRTGDLKFLGRRLRICAKLDFGDAVDGYQSFKP